MKRSNHQHQPQHQQHQQQYQDFNLNSSSLSSSSSLSKWNLPTTPTRSNILTTRTTSTSRTTSTNTNTTATMNTNNNHNNTNSNHKKRLESEYLSRNSIPPYFNQYNSKGNVVNNNNNNNSNGIGDDNNNNNNYMIINKNNTPQSPQHHFPRRKSLGSTSLSSLSSPFLRRGQSLGTTTTTTMSKTTGGSSSEGLIQNHHIIDKKDDFNTTTNTNTNTLITQQPHSSLSTIATTTNHNNNNTTTTTSSSNMTSIHNRPKTTFINCPKRIQSSLEFMLKCQYDPATTTTTTTSIQDNTITTTKATTASSSEINHTNNNLVYSNSTNTTTTANTMYNTPLKSNSRNASFTTNEKDNKQSMNNNKNSDHGITLNNHNNNVITNDNTLKKTNLIITPTWRLKERMKTVGVGLILALNIGTDPPDVHKPNPCSKLICWMDPSSTSRAKAREKIADLLVNQYAQWQGPPRAKLKYKKAPDPTVEDVRNLCFSMRRAARNERLLLHYNGYGVPRPTTNGEIWVFDRHHRQYIPLAVSDLKKWIGKPSLIVLDCSGAGALLPYLANSNYHVGGSSSGAFLDSSQDANNKNNMSHSTSGFGLNESTSSSNNNLSSPKPMATTEADNEGNNDLATSIREFIVLCPTSASETLPMNPELPADLFTSCLTTPIPTALRWFVHQNPLGCSVIEPDDVDRIPGKLTDRKTPLGELNWIFTAITDNIAWSVLPSALFQRLFRQDLVVANMFRNFLLADRILRGLNCTPMSHPPLPPTCDHPLWQSWDLAVETCLSQLMREGVLGPKRPLDTPGGKENDEDLTEENKDVVNSDHMHGVTRAKSDGVLSSNNINLSGNITGPIRSHSSPQTSNFSYNITAPFFAEQLTAFEIWLDFAVTRIKEGGVILNPPTKQHESQFGRFDINSPEQLPVVLQVLLSPSHRLRALGLLRRFLYLGPSAVNLALSVGIFPYVLRLLQSQIDEYKHVLVGIWNKILEFDPSCQVDLVKDGALPHFINHLNWGSEQNNEVLIKDQNNHYKSHSFLSTAQIDFGHQKTMAAVILSAICFGYPNGQSECFNHNLHGVCCRILQSIEETDLDSVPSKLRMWLCICLGVMFDDMVNGREKAFRSDVHLRLFSRENSDESPDVRAAACFAIGSLVGPSDRCIITKEEKTFEHQEANNKITPQLLSPSTLSYNSTSHQSGLSPLRNISTEGQLQPMHQYSNMSYNLSELKGEQIFSQPQTNQSIMHIFSPQPQSVFDDKISLSRDLLIVENMIRSCNDASPTVRYEATVVLGKVVDRYLMAFVAVSNNASKDTEGKQDSGIVMPDGIDEETKNAFSRTWKVMRHLHDSDPHPAVSGAATSILRFVNEHILVFKTNFHRVKEKRRVYSARRLDIMGLNKMENDDNIPQKQYSRTLSTINLGEHSKNKTPLSRLSSLHEVNESDGSERSQSPIAPNALRDDISMFEKEDLDGHIQIDLMNILPTSKFYEWKKKIFAEEDTNAAAHLVDPLSLDGAIHLYREQRNLRIDMSCTEMSDSFAILQPKRKATGNILDGLSSFEATDDFLGMDDDSNHADLNVEVSLTKNALHLKETSLLSNDQKKGTYMLQFHAYEPVLASSDGQNRVTLWDTSRASKIDHISNAGSTDVRMTSMCWINERNNSLLLTGCEDGTVRIFDNTVKYPTYADKNIELSTAFNSMPELKPNKRGSGLITEWQQYNGHLITGGNVNIIRCWDLESQKCLTKIDTNSGSACLTTFATAWDYVQSTGNIGGFSGLGPDIVLGGYSDGIIKVFDLRAHYEQASSLKTRNNHLRRRKDGQMAEHDHWIVNVCFTNYGSSNEVVSGSIYGDVKFWDMRNLRSSVDTQEIQRSPMTAFVSHPRIPLLASGSHANYVKLFTPDGDVLQVIRNHNGRAGRKIGPISILSFHPNKKMLAAGATDEIISIYESSNKM